MRRLLLVVVLLLAAAPAHGRARLATGTVHAIDASGRDAYALVDSRDAQRPLAIVRSDGRRVRRVALVGEPGAEFPDIALAAGGRIVAAWARAISGGEALAAARFGWSPYFLPGEPEVLEAGQSTGPAKLAAAGDRAVLAFPDRAGDIATTALAGPPAAAVLTADAPAIRHLALDATMGEEGPLVLDLAQRRRRTTLRVLGPGAPPRAVVSIGGLRHLSGTVAAAGDRVAVAYMSSGRAILASSRGGRWTVRRLPGGGGGEGAPAVGITGGEVFVAYSQKVRSSREILLFGPDGARRLTRGRGDDRDPVAATGPRGTAYVAWTRLVRGRATALLRRVALVR